MLIEKNKITFLTIKGLYTFLLRLSKDRQGTLPKFSLDNEKCKEIVFLRKTINDLLGFDFTFNGQDLHLTFSQWKLRVFMDWLEKNNAKEVYLSAITYQRGMEDPIKCVNAVIDSHFIGIIDYTLYWERTREGHGYWSQLNDAWKDYVRKKNRLHLSTV